jgi:hypothetical protein
VVPIKKKCLSQLKLSVELNPFLARVTLISITFLVKMYLANTVIIAIYYLGATADAQATPAQPVPVPTLASKPPPWKDQIASCKTVGKKDEDINRQNCIAGICLNMRKFKGCDHPSRSLFAFR